MYVEEEMENACLLRCMVIRAQSRIVMSQLLQELRPPYGCLGDRRGGSAGLSVLGGGGRGGLVVNID